MYVYLKGPKGVRDYFYPFVLLYVLLPELLSDGYHSDGTASSSSQRGNGCDEN